MGKVEEAMGLTDRNGQLGHVELEEFLCKVFDFMENFAFADEFCDWMERLSTGR